MPKNKYPTLFIRTKTGKINVWEVWSEKDEMCTSWGVLDGKIQTSRKKSIGTNIGKSNERNPEQQADFDAGSLHRQKLDEGYSVSPETAKEAVTFLPMLAHKLENLDKLKGKTFDLQPKLDGVRALAYWENNQVILMSRGGKSYSVPHIQKELSELLPIGYILDGEIYAKGLSCQTITSYVKKNKPGSEKLVYNVFDVPSAAGPWCKRIETLDWYSTALGDEFPNFINVVEIIQNAKIEDIDKKHDQWVNEGYEGAIIRLHDGEYEWGERSRNLLKYKKFLDSEFIVVKVRAGEGKLSKAAVFTCKNDLTDATFDVIYAGTIEQREEQLTNSLKYVGKPLTVRFFDRTNDNLPRFPVGKVFRDGKDV